MILPNGMIMKEERHDDGDIRYHISLMQDHHELTIILTGEGVIMDASSWNENIDGVVENEIIGTVGMTYDEWFDFVVDKIGDVYG